MQKAEHCRYPLGDLRVLDKQYIHFPAPSGLLHTSQGVLRFAYRTKQSQIPHIRLAEVQAVGNKHSNITSEVPPLFLAMYWSYSCNSKTFQSPQVALLMVYFHGPY